MDTKVLTGARALSGLLAVVFSGMLLAGCGGDGGGGGVGPDPDKPVPPPPLALEDGFAWTDSVGNGLVFLSDTAGSVFRLYRYSDVWMIAGDGEFRVNKDSIVISDIGSGTYSVGGDTLSLTIDGEETVFAKTKAGYKPNELVLWFNRAWATAPAAIRDGFMFLPDGRVFSLDYGWASDGGWRIVRKGGYNIQGGESADIEIYWGADTISGTFAVEDDTLRLSLPVGAGGRPVERKYTKVSGVKVDY